MVVPAPSVAAERKSLYIHFSTPPVFPKEHFVVVHIIEKVVKHSIGMAVGCVQERLFLFICV